jgi:predicted DsbA family dithiol-disulfide isomerase
MPPRNIRPPDAPKSPVEERGERLGITFNRGRTITSNSHLSLEAAEFAFEAGNDWAFHRRMFKAYFEDLDDIGDLETVVRLGVEAGLDGAGLRTALSEGRFRERVDEGIDWSRGIGVTAIPTFVFDGRYGMVGAQEIDAFRAMMEKIGRPPKN